MIQVWFVRISYKQYLYHNKSNRVIGKLLAVYSWELGEAPTLQEEDQRLCGTKYLLQDATVKVKCCKQSLACNVINNL